MARRLKECGYSIAAVYDVNADAAQALVITVVTDDWQRLGRKLPK